MTNHRNYINSDQCSICHMTGLEQMRRPDLGCMPRWWMNMPEWMLSLRQHILKARVAQLQWALADYSGLANFRGGRIGGGPLPYWKNRR